MMIQHRSLSPTSAVVLALLLACYYQPAQSFVSGTFSSRQTIFTKARNTDNTARQFLRPRSPTTCCHHSTSRQRTATIALHASSSSRPDSSKLSVSTSSSSTDDIVDLTPLAFGTAPETVHPRLESGTDEANHGENSLTNIGELPLHELALAGSITTLIADISMHPIDCIKTVQQSDSGLDFSFVQAAAYLWETSGVMGFYHGFLLYALADGTGGALKFAVWELWKRSSENWSVPTWISLWAGAGLAFVASSIFIVPGELIKQQLQMSHYDGLIEAVTGIYATHGWPGFFVGYEGVLYRDIPYTMLELGLYEVFKQFLDARRSPNEQSNTFEQIMAAAVTGGITAFVTTPIDVVKTKLMVDTEYLDASFLQCMIASIQNHGWHSVFAGVWARIGWILPFTAIYLPTYDALKSQLWKRHLQNQRHANSSNSPNADFDEIESESTSA